MIALTIKHLHRILKYNPKNGVFTHLVWRPGRVAGSTNTTGYLQIEIGNKAYCAHRLAWFYVHGRWPPHELDHINRDISDNRLSNLRLATRQQNVWNTRGHTRSRTGLKGASFEPKRRGKKFRALIRVDGRYKSLGLFKTAAEAHSAYRAAALSLCGEFFYDARLSYRPTSRQVASLPHGKTFSEHAGSSC